MGPTLFSIDGVPAKIRTANWEEVVIDFASALAQQQNGEQGSLILSDSIKKEALEGFTKLLVSQIRIDSSVNLEWAKQIVKGLEASSTLSHCPLGEQIVFWMEEERIETLTKLIK